MVSIPAKESSIPLTITLTIQLHTKQTQNSEEWGSYPNPSPTSWGGGSQALTQLTVHRVAFQFIEVNMEDKPKYFKDEGYYSLPIFGNCPRQVNIRYHLLDSIYNKNNNCTLFIYTILV